MKTNHKQEELGQFMTIEEAMKRLNTSKGTIYNLINDNKIKKYKLTKKATRLKESDIITYIENLKS